MKIQTQVTYKNHIYENGVLMRGFRTKRIVKPDSEGMYLIKCKGEIERVSLDTILNTHKEIVKKADMVVCEKIKFNPYIVIDLHMKGFSTKNIVDETGKSPEHINAIKRKFIGITSFKKMCENFNIAFASLKRVFNLDTVNGIDQDDKLRLISKYLKEHSTSANTSRKERCAMRGYDYGSMANWIKYNGYTLGPDNFEECLELYEKRIKKK